MLLLLVSKIYLANDCLFECSPVKFCLIHRLARVLTGSQMPVRLEARVGAKTVLNSCNKNSDQRR